MPSNNRRPLYTSDDLASGMPAAPAAVETPPGAAAVSGPASINALGRAPAPKPRATSAASALPQSPSDSAGAAVADCGGAGAAAAAPQLEQPCTLKGLSSAAYAGALGYFFGAVPATVRHRGRNWGLVHAAGMTSATQLALMSGLYTAVHCICNRIRQKEDGINRGLAGCATGLALGWKAGPWSAAQSCLGIGALSYWLDLGTAAGAAQAREVWPKTGSSSSSGSNMASAGGQRQSQKRKHAGARPSLQLQLPPLALPPLMWLGACCGGAADTFFDACPLAVQDTAVAVRGARRR